MPRRQILCLSGGGYAGLFAAKFLALLEAQDPTGTKIGERFDAIAGTSVGGLIALALAKGNSAARVLEVMQQAGSEVFPDLLGDLSQKLFAPKYNSQPLQKHAKTLLGATTLGEVDKRILIPAVSLSAGEPKLFRACPGRAEPDSGIALLDVALASSAAPTYFAPHPIGHDLFVDGGLIANAPDCLAILEALTRWGWPKDDLVVLSVGTTYTPPGVLTHARGGWGLFRWMWGDRKLLRISMAAQMSLARKLAIQLLPDGRFLRVDPALSPAQAKAIGLDVASEEAKCTLQALAQDECGKLSAAQRKQLLTHTSRWP